jgi:hypothetical protein
MLDGTISPYLGGQLGAHAIGHGEAGRGWARPG